MCVSAINIKINLPQKNLKFLFRNRLLQKLHPMPIISSFLNFAMFFHTIFWCYKTFLFSNSASCTLCGGRLFKYWSNQNQKSLTLWMSEVALKKHRILKNRIKTCDVPSEQQLLTFGDLSFFDFDSTNIWIDVLSKGRIREMFFLYQKMILKNIAKFKNEDICHKTLNCSGVSTKIGVF